MNAPVLTVRYNGPPRTFAAGNDVVVGRDLRADVRIAHPLVSRAHLVLRFDRGRWVAVDNGSLNGMYVNGRRVQEVDIADGMTVNIGNPDGPPLSFEVGRHAGSAGRPPQTATVVIDQPTQHHPGWGPSPSQPMYPGSRPQPVYPPPTQPPGRPPTQPPPRPPIQPRSRPIPPSLPPETNISPPTRSRPPRSNWPTSKA